MKIAILTQAYPPAVSGMAVVSQRLACGMAQRGHRVLVLTASDKSEPYTLEQENLDIHRLPSLPNPLRRGQRFVPWSQHRVLDALEDFAPDVLHMHDPSSLATAGLEFARQHTLARLLTIHALPGIVTAYTPDLLRHATEDLLWWYADWFLPQFTALIAPTETTAQMVKDHTGTDVIAISNGVDTSRFSPQPPDPELRRVCGLPPDVPAILYVGRLDREKAVDIAIQAAAQVMQHTPAHLLIIGDGTERSDLEALCIDLEIAQRTHFCGFMRQSEQLAGVYNLSTVFITACEVETQGMVLLEAAACGLPIVAFRAGGIPEVVKEGVTGLLAPAGDADELGRHLRYILEHPELACEMGTAGRKLAEEHSLERTLSRYELCYQLARLHMQALGSWEIDNQPMLPESWR